MTYVRNVERLPDGRYRVRRVIWGRVYQRTFSTRRGAGLYLEMLELKAAGVAMEDAPRTLHGLVQSYLDRLKTRGRAGATWDFYYKRSAHLLEHLGAGADPRVNQRQVEEYAQTRLREGVGGVTVLKELTALRSMLKVAGYALDWRLPDLQVEHRVRRFPSDLEVARLWDELRRTGPEVWRGFALGLLTGMRASEIEALRWGRVDLAERTILVNVAKTGTENRTAVVETLAEALGPAGPADALVVPVTFPAVQYRMRRASRDLGLTPLWTGWGFLRHVCATWAHEAGYTPEQVSLLLAHQRPGSRMTRDHYLHAQAVTLKRRMLHRVEGRLLAALSRVQAVA